MSTVRGLGGLQGLQPPERHTLSGAPGFGDSLDALLRPQASPTRTAAPGELSFSKHASARMESRGIQLDEQDHADLNSALDNLAKRGAKESLVLMGDNAFIVGVPDRKIITVLTRNEAAGNIFTNIDSTAVVR